MGGIVIRELGASPLLECRDLFLVLLLNLVRRDLQATALELECLRLGFLGLARELGERLLVLAPCIRKLFTVPGAHLV